VTTQRSRSLPPSANGVGAQAGVGSPASSRPVLLARDRALAARGLTLVQIAALVGGAPVGWVRRYVPGRLPRGFRHPAPVLRKVPSTTDWTFDIAYVDEEVDLDALRAAYLRLLLASSESQALP
jgi:hypothetical protein